MINKLGWPTRLTRRALIDGEHVLFDHMVEQDLLKIEVERQQRLPKSVQTNNQPSQEAARRQFLSLLAQGIAPRDALNIVKGK